MLLGFLNRFYPALGRNHIQPNSNRLKAFLSQGFCLRFRLIGLNISQSNGHAFSSQDLGDSQAYTLSGTCDDGHFGKAVECVKAI